MEFEDCPYQCQQVPSRTREDKVVAKDRDALEKSRLVSRVEHHRRFQPYGDIVKPPDQTSVFIDDVDRFNRDYTQDQRTTKRVSAELTLARASARHNQQVEYQKAIEEQRRLEALEFSKMQEHMHQHDFLLESVCYNPATNEVPPEGSPKGTAQRELDATKEQFREARARRIQHCSNSQAYDPITGYPRTFW
jgi:hypothetical protein